MQREREDLEKVENKRGLRSSVQNRRGQERNPEVPEWIGMERTLKNHPVPTGFTPSAKGWFLDSRAPTPQQLEPPEVPKTCFHFIFFPLRAK